MPIDDFSGCSSPIQRPLKPPAPAFDLDLPRDDRPITWEHCTRILDGKSTTVSTELNDLLERDFPEQPQRRHREASILKKIFKPLALARTSTQKSAASSPVLTRLSSPEPEDSDPRVSSSANNASDEPFSPMADVYRQEFHTMGNWLQQQKRQALVDKAQGHLDALQSMLDCVARSMHESHELDLQAKVMYQRRSSRYYAS